MAPQRLAERLAAIRGLLLDWDGVFNGGAKGDGTASTFSEADSMGLNLLRFGLWQMQGRELPVAAIVTGEDNPSARLFATRERFHALYRGVRNKRRALEALCAAHGLAPAELICIFDDVNDLAMASDCGIRVLVRRRASPSLQEYVAARALCDYITAHEADRHAIRETAELLLELMGSFETVIGSRIAFDDDYARYFAARQAVSTELVEEIGAGPAP
jgi:3-deoxy-D-manno-octulosonate 8-phosphate phosphatase (KDO 8-P phosphatase)